MGERKQETGGREKEERFNLRVTEAYFSEDVKLRDLSKAATLYIKLRSLLCGENVQQRSMRSINFTCTRATRKIPDKMPAPRLRWSKTALGACVGLIYTRRPEKDATI